MGYEITIECKAPDAPYADPTTGHPVLWFNKSYIRYETATVIQILPQNMGCYNSTAATAYGLDVGVFRLNGNLTIAETGTLISGVLLVWSIAWVFRQVIRQISNRR